MESIYDIADYFLSKEAMTHKKLQKLCYYAQAWHLANFGEPLVPNRFEAWVHGPVCPDLYCKYKDWGWATIPMNHKITTLGEKIKKYLDKVYEIYHQYDGDELEKMTHMELPWQEARGDCRAWDYSRNPILWDTMKRYYAKRIGKSYEY